jgi:hypothetical protein
VLYLSTFELGAVALAVLIRRTTVLLTIEIFARRKEFVCGGARDSAPLAAFWLRRSRAMYEPWQNTEWRKLASRFLGPELSPPIEDILIKPAREEPSATNVEKLSTIIKDKFARAMAPHHLQVRWQKWYGVLRVYFPAPQNAQLAFGNFYFSVLNSIGLAGLVSACISHRHVSWLVWLLCVLAIGVSHVSFVTGFSQQQNPDSSGDQLAAAILTAIKSREQK